MYRMATLQKLPSLVLVMPPQFELLNGFSAGLVSLANYAKLVLPELKVRLHDLSGVPFERVRDSVGLVLGEAGGQGKDLVIGISTTTASYQSALEVAGVFKKELPNCTILFGGPHASAEPETILSHHQDTVDAIIVGEGEAALVQFLKAFPKLEGVPGACFLRGGELHTNPQPPPLTQSELDSIEVFFDGHAFGTPGKFDHATYVSARGCPMQCSFCAVGNDVVRTKSVSRVIEDIRFMAKQGYSRIALEDNFFGYSLDRTTELCSGLAALRSREGLKFTWECQTRVESMERADVINVMERAGCEAVYLGVESFNCDHLLYLRKTTYPYGFLNKLFEKVVPGLLNSRIACNVNLQLGLPGEANTHREKTLESVSRLGKMASAAGKTVTLFPMVHVVYPGTALFMSGIESGRFPPDVFESFTHWERDQIQVLRWLGEHFAHGAGGLPEGILDASALRAGEFRIQEDRVAEINLLLKELGKIQGVDVFQYGRFLVKSHS